MTGRAPRRGATAVGVGLIGSGSAARAYLRTLDSLVGRGLAWAGPICARNPEARQRLLAARSAAELVTTPEEVTGSAVDLVLITTPPASHAQLTRQALERGKHVVVEKPLATDPAEARELAALALSGNQLLLAAPFVQMSPAIRQLWMALGDGLAGRIHSARAMYGNPGSDWASWYHTSHIGPLGDLAIYNVKTLTALLGPAVEARALQSASGLARHVGGVALRDVDPDVVHLVLRHRDGALATIMASHAVWAYRRTAVEMYGTEGTANLLGDDWDPAGFEIFRHDWGHWRSYATPDRTWNWTAGLAEAVGALANGTPAVADLEHDLHVLDVLAAAAQSAREDGRPAPIRSEFGPLRLACGDNAPPAVVHDHTRPPSEQ